MTSVTEGSHTTDIDGSSLDVDWVRDTVTVIQLMNLSRSTRADIDARTNECMEHLRELLAVDLGADQDDDVMKVFRRAHRHLELSNRPTSDTPAFHTFAYMRETATITFALLKFYGARNEASSS
ncbi:hypothetical protein [Streptomyces prunicolor]|uniref:hypothetical protein n=1 Tax=Streptomyces prunicolor TaxID=67348 RepID=UPI0033C0CF0B